MADGAGRSPTARSLTWSLATLASAVVLAGGVEAVLFARTGAGPVWANEIFVLAGLVYAAAGIVAWQRRPSNGMGAIMIGGGLVWLASGLFAAPQRWLAAVGEVTATLPLAIVVHLLLAFPSGRLRDAADRALIIAAYVTALVIQVPRYLFDPSASPAGVLAAMNRPDIAEAGTLAQDTIGGLGMVVAAVLLAGKLRRATPRQRRVLFPLYVYGIIAVLFIPFGPDVLAPLTGMTPIVLGGFQVLALTLVPVAFAAGVLLGGFARQSEVHELASWLGAAGPGQPPLDRALARALGDDSVRLAFWLPGLPGYADAAGHAVELPPAGPAYGVAEVELDGRRIGAIIYDATLIADPGLVTSAGQVVAIAVDRQRLTAELLASREALRESRARLVETADAERRRIAQDLHDGLQARLVLLALEAQQLTGQADCPAPVAAAAAELRARIDSAAADLRATVHEVMPAALIEGGLPDAVRDLADRLPVPVRLDLAVHGDLPAAVASTAYFVLAEAVTNALRHARPAGLDIRLATSDDTLAVEVADDGSGGATVGTGLGLRGLTDRVEALGGTLLIDSPAGHGTRLLASLPCTPAPAATPQASPVGVL